MGGRESQKKDLDTKGLMTDCKNGHTSRFSPPLNVASQSFASTEGLSFPNSESGWPCGLAAEEILGQF